MTTSGTGQSKSPKLRAGFKTSCQCHPCSGVPGLGQLVPPTRDWLCPRPVPENVLKVTGLPRWTKDGFVQRGLRRCRARQPRRRGPGTDVLKPALKQGFTLIEVLIAFAILTSSLVLISAALSRHLNALQLLQRSMSAHRLAERQLIEAILRRQVRSEISARGEEAGLSWELSVKPVSLESPPVEDLQMEAVTAQVSWPFRGQARSSSLTTALSLLADES